jgi:hypothetical protein
MIHLLSHLCHYTLKFFTLCLHFILLLAVIICAVGLKYPSSVFSLKALLRSSVSNLLAI